MPCDDACYSGQLARLLPVRSSRESAALFRGRNLFMEVLSACTRARWRSLSKMSHSMSCHPTPPIPGGRPGNKNSAKGPRVGSAIGQGQCPGIGQRTRTGEGAGQRARLPTGA
jgi:hypothetical protein